MIPLLIVLPYFLFCILQKKPINILCSIIVLLPFHKVVRQILFVFCGDYGIFPIWIEIGCFVLLLKTVIGYNKATLTFRKFNGTILILICIFLIYISVFFVLGVKTEEKAVANYRMYLDCIVLLLASSIIPIYSVDLKKIIKCIVVTALIMAVMNIIQYFFLRDVFSLFFDSSLSISSTIMGYERMYGLMSPNLLGITTAIFLVIMTFTLYNRTKDTSKIDKYILLLTILLNGVCLILTFSRAGWAVFAISWILISYRHGKIFLLLKNSFNLVLIGGMVIGVAFILFPETWKIIHATFSGEESSAATRSTAVLDVYEHILENPLGHGVGSSLQENGPIAESSLLNIAYEIGIHGLGYLLFIWICFYVKIIFNGNNLIYIVISGIFVASAITACVSVNIFNWPYMYYFWTVIGLGLNPSFKTIKYEPVNFGYHRNLQRRQNIGQCHSKCTEPDV
jgi:hypothetical protein